MVKGQINQMDHHNEAGTEQQRKPVLTDEQAFYAGFVAQEAERFQRWTQPSAPDSKKEETA